MGDLVAKLAFLIVLLSWWCYILLDCCPTYLPRKLPKGSIRPSNDSADSGGTFSAF